MKKFLLLSGLILGSFYANAQLTCATATPISANGVYKCPAITGTYNNACGWQGTTTDAGGTLYGIWYAYTPVSSGDVTITAALPQNVAPNSDDTKVSIFTGTCAALVCETGNDDTSDTEYLSTISFPVTSGVTYYILWDNYWNANGFDFDVNLNACASPVSITAPTNVTLTSATLNWEASPSLPFQYEVEYGPVGFTQGSGVTKTTFTNSLNLSGLNSSGNYDFYVRSLCGGSSKSAWSGPGILSLIKVVPYASNFDSADELAGWNVAGGWQVTFGISTTAVNAQTPTNYIAFGTDTAAAVNNWLFTPALSLTAGQKISTSFYVRTTTAADNRKLKITIGNNQTIAAQTTTMYSNDALNSNPNYTQIITPDYTVPTTGIYFIGINDYSAAAATAATLRFDTFAVNVGGLSVNDFISNKFDVYPNPTNGIISITNSENITVDSITITDLNGRIVKTTDYNNISNIKINISDLSEGVYMMSIKSDKGNATKKIIKN